MGAGLVEADRMGGWGEEEEDEVRMGGDAEEDRVGGWGEEAASTGGEEDEEEEERTGGWGEERRGFPSCSRWEAPLSNAPGRSPLSSEFLKAMVSKAFSMLSLSALRSENQQSTSVLDSLVSWASWSAAEQSSVDQMSRVIYKWMFFGSLGIQSPSWGLKMGSLKTFLLFLSCRRLPETGQLLLGERKWSHMLWTVINRRKHDWICLKLFNIEVTKWEFWTWQEHNQLPLTLIQFVLLQVEKFLISSLKVLLRLFSASSQHERCLKRDAVWAASWLAAEV